MERFLASIVTRHSARFYTGPRNGTRHISSSAPTRAQVKTPPAQKKAKSDISRCNEGHEKIKAGLHPIARQITTMTNEKANSRMERALLKATSELQFYGDVIIKESKKNAITTANETSSKSFADDQHMVIFADGSLVWKPQGKSVSIAHLGAAVVYKRLKGGQEWQVRSFLAVSNKRNSVLAELIAIAQSLAVATELVMHLRLQNGSGAGGKAAKYRVTIFSDCQSALGLVNNLRGKKPIDNKQVCNDPFKRKIITRSQQLRRLGIRPELRWVPGHAKVDGHNRADRAAYLAANSQGITVPLDEGLRLIELEAARHKKAPNKKKKKQ
ncbi:hypothetical protein ACQKWADRAFT_278862 [Trichoderma austrokoningii]